MDEETVERVAAQACASFSAGAQCNLAENLSLR